MSCTVWAPLGIIPGPGAAIAAERWASGSLPVHSSVFMPWDRPLAGGEKPVRFTVYKPSVSSKSVFEVLYPTHVSPRQVPGGWVCSGERCEHESDASMAKKGWVTGTRPRFAVWYRRYHGDGYIVTVMTVSDTRHALES